MKFAIKNTGITTTRIFGYVAGAVLSMYGMLIRQRIPDSDPWLLLLAAAVLILAVFAPGGLFPLQWIFRCIGKIITRTISESALILLYYGIMTPMGIVSRRKRQKTFGFNRIKGTLTYWNTKNGEQPETQSYENPF